MVVGVCRITLSIPGNDSLKGKRAVVRPLLDRVRARFSVAAAEVDAMDSHRTAVLGFAVVSNDGAHANSMIDTVADFVAAQGKALVVGRNMELLHVGELGMGRRHGA
ncbi:MAG: DUF503 domain-containing protein [Polyangiales bacterium]